MMDVFQTIKTRKSVRRFKKDPIPEESLKKILEAGRLAPSARNSQNWKFIVVQDPQRKKQLAEAAGQDFIGEAFLVIVPVSLKPDEVMRCGVPTYAVDLSIAASFMVLQAYEEGLGTCWVGGFSQEKVKEILKIPPDYKVLTLLPLGFPDESPLSKPRKPMDEVVCYNFFKE